MSPARARVLREAGEKFDRAEAAKRAERQANIARTNATLAHPNSVVRGMAATLLALNNTQSNSRPGGSSSLNASSRGGRVANVASKTGANVMARAVEGKATSPGSPSRFAHLAGAGDTSRFAAFAAASDAGAVEAAAQAERRQTLADVPASHGMRAAAIRGAILANAGRVPDSKSSPEHVAAFILTAGTKAREQKPLVTAAAPAQAKPDLSTSDGVAAFILASSAKGRGQRHDMTTAEGIAVHAVALAKSAGVIR